MSTVCYLLGITLCLSVNAVSELVKPFPVVRPEQASKVYAAMQLPIKQKEKSEGIPIEAGIKYVIYQEFFGKAPIPLDTVYDPEALDKIPGIFVAGTLAGNLLGVLKALYDMTLAGYPGKNILVIYALDYWTSGHERSQDVTKFYTESMNLLLALTAAGAGVYQFTTDQDPQRDSAETEVCFTAQVENLIFKLYNSTPGLIFVDGWMGTGAKQLITPEDKLKMEVSTTGLKVVITSWKNIITFNSKQEILKNLVEICNDINSGLHGTDGTLIAAQYVPCKYLFSMFVSKPFVNMARDIMKDVIVLVLFLEPKDSTSPNFYDTALKDPASFGLDAQEIDALKIYQAVQKSGKKFVVYDPSTHDIVA